MRILLGDQEPALITVDGEIDFSTSPDLRETLHRVSSKGYRSVRLNLSSVDFIDSSGIGLLFRFAHGLAQNGGELALTGYSRYVYNTLFRLGLINMFRLPNNECLGLSLKRKADRFGDCWLVSSFTVPTHPSSPAVVRERFGQLIADLPFSEAEDADVKLAVGEAVTNAVKYGGVTAEDTVSICCTADSSRLVVVISDSGPGFDRTALSYPHPDELPTRGMGIPIMELVMDEVIFENAAGMTVRMVKNLQR